MRARPSSALISLGRWLLFCLILAMPSFQAHARIAFMSDRDGNKEIYVMDASGGNLRNLTNNPATDGWAAWSPNGVHIAFTSDRDGNYGIYVMDAKGRGVRNLTRNPADDSSPDWSPDGKRIAFESVRDDELNIFVMDSDGNNLQQLTSSDVVHEGPFGDRIPPPTDNRMPKWSPLGDRIAFVSFRDWNYEIYVMDTDGGNPQRLTDNIIAYESSPSWSPSGRHIAFSSNRDSENPADLDDKNGFHIYVMDADGSNSRRLTDASGWDGVPFWSPDGESIAFTSNRMKEAQFDIYVMDIDGGNLRRLTDAASSDFGMDWVPPGLSVLPIGKQFTMWGRLKGDLHNVAPDAADSTTRN